MRVRGAIGVVDVSGRGFRLGDHVCWSYGSDDEHFQVLTEYFAEGLEAGEKLFYIAPRGRERCVVDYLSESGFQPQDLIRHGQLHLAAVEDAYLPDGRFDPGRRLREYEEQVRLALLEGFSGLRLAAEAAPLLDHPGIPERWPAYELRADLLAARVPFAAVCAYDRRECGVADLAPVEAVHNRCLHGDDHRKPFFHLFAAAPDTLVLGGEVDISCSELLEHLLASAATDLRRLRLDVSSLGFVDVAGMRALVAAVAGAPGESECVIRGASPLFRRMWQLLGCESLPRVRLDHPGASR